MTETVSGEDFTELAARLGKFKAGSLTGRPSDQALARAVGVSPTTVGDWLRGTRFPQQVDQFLAVVRLIDAEAASRLVTRQDLAAAGLPDEPGWRAAHRVEAQRRAGVVSDGVVRAQARQVLGLGRPLAEVTDPFALEVHWPVQPEQPVEGLAVLPVYVPRDHDEALAEIVREATAGCSGIAVLVGGSSTGKTRACWQALELLRDGEPGWRVWHPIDPSRPEAALRDLAGIGPRTVVWLNEAQFYLATADQTGERIAAGLRELLRDTSRGPVVVLTTLWPQFWDDLTSRPQGGEDRHAQARELLAGHDITVPAAFTSAQLSLLKLAGDPRLAQAMAGAADGQVIQYLAGVPELLARYRNAPPAAKAVIEAAMDARRLGMRPALPHAFLAAAAPGYMLGADWDQVGEDWLEKVLAYTARPCKGVRGPVSWIRPRPRSAGELPSGQSVPVYQLADYLDQLGRRTRQEMTPPATFWTAAVACAHAGDLGRLGNTAYNYGLYQYAAQLYKKAAAAGDAEAAASLVQRMHQLTPEDMRPAAHAAAHASLDNPAAVASLLRVLRETGADDQIRVLLARDLAAHASLDNPAAVASLLIVLREVGGGDQIWALATRVAEQTSPDDVTAVIILLRGLREVGAGDQIRALATRVAAHAPLDNPAAVASLLRALREVGAGDQIQALSTRIPLDDPALGGELLRALGEVGADEQVCALLARDLVIHAPLHDPAAVAGLLEALWRIGADEQMRALLARDPVFHASLDDPNEIAVLLQVLREVGEDDQVQALATRAVTHISLDYPATAASLRETLQESGMEEQVQSLLARDLATQASLDDPAAVAWLLEMLQEVGADDQVQELLARDPAAQASLDDTSAVTDLLQVLREVGADDQVQILATRAATYASLDYPEPVAILLKGLREVGAEDQVRALLARDPAIYPFLEFPNQIAKLLKALRDAGADDQVQILATRAATQGSLRDSFVADRLLKALREAKALEQVDLLISRLPAAGLFGLYCEGQKGRPERFRFGGIAASHNSDYHPASPWDWVDLS